jgi:hypothetical protein
MAYTTPKVVYTTLGIYHGIYKNRKMVYIMVYTIDIYHGIYHYVIV